MVTASTVPALRARGLAVPFGTAAGLSAIDLDVAPGERLALLGPSGSGKTSLLRSLAGLQPLAAGAVLVDDRDVTGMPPERRGIVYMHQAPSLFPHLSVLQNVTFPLDVRGRGRREADAVARAWLARMRLEGFADRSPSSLSGGQRHRVALARALTAAPRVLLLDEPFASLDPELRAEVRDAVVEVLSAPGAPAAIVVTHDVDEAAVAGDRVAIVLEGRLTQSGAAADVFARPVSAAVARFLGTTNLVAGTRDAEGRVHSVLGTWPSPGPAGPMHLAVRPGYVRVCETHASTTTAGPLVRVDARVASVHERVSGTFVSLQWTGAPSAPPWLAVVSGAVPRLGDTVVVEIAHADIHVIDPAAQERGDVR